MKRVRILCSLFVGGLLALAGLWLSQRRYVYHDVQEVPPRPVAIVFGAAVYPGGRPSPVLADRVEAAVELYKAGKVRHILMSGDNQTVYYNEPGAMMRYATELGVPTKVLHPDYGGRRTYDTCYRARYIFQVKQAILVTQDFHLSRALFICRHMGIDAVGYSADRRAYPLGDVVYWYVREVFALARAVIDLILGRPAAVGGEPLPIE